MIFCNKGWNNLHISPFPNLFRSRWTAQRIPVNYTRDIIVHRLMQTQLHFLFLHSHNPMRRQTVTEVFWSVRLKLKKCWRLLIISVIRKTQLHFLHDIHLAAMRLSVWATRTSEASDAISSCERTALQIGTTAFDVPRSPLEHRDPPFPIHLL